MPYPYQSKAKKPPDIEDSYTAAKVYEGSVTEEERSRFQERQKMLLEEMTPQINEAIQSTWNNPGHFLEFLHVMEHFSRGNDQLGRGAENALLIYRKFGASATYLISSLETEEKDWWKKSGTKAVNVFLYEQGKNNSYRTAIRAFDLSQMQDKLPLAPPPKSRVNLQTLVKSILSASRGYHFVTKHSAEITESVFVPSENGEPAQLIVPSNLSEAEFKQETLYCFTQFTLSLQEGYTVNPETDFIARCAANILCIRYGFAPKPVSMFPQSVQKTGQVKELLSRIEQTSATAAHFLQELISRQVQREPLQQPQPPKPTQPQQEQEGGIPQR